MVLDNKQIFGSNNPQHEPIIFSENFQFFMLQSQQEK